MKRFAIVLAVLIILVLGVNIVVSVVTSGKHGVSLKPVRTTGSAVDVDELDDLVPGADTKPPVIEGLSEVIIVTVGESVSYKSGVTVTDDTDPEPMLSIDASDVDLNKPGKYTVIYTATDASGNTTEKEVTVRVQDKDAITVEQANEMADEIIGRIISSGMSDYEKLFKVYKFVLDLGYVDINYGDIDDYLENAWYYYHKGLGDCRCTFGLSKLLLERLGYDVITVRNNKGLEMDHYWALVSTDGGKSWYHFDPLGWKWIKGEDDYVCMRTDDWLEDYFEEHKESNWWAYEYDHSKYPATPVQEFEKK